MLNQVTQSELPEGVSRSRKAGILKYHHNPFWSSTEIKTRGKRVTVQSGTYQSDDGDSQDYAGIHVVQRTDKAKFVKIYQGHLKALFGFKPTTLKVLLFVLDQVQQTPNSDSVYIAWEHAERWFKEQQMSVGESTFRKGIRELLEGQIIAESDAPLIYWTNPNYYWNGDRYTFWQTHIMES